MYTGAKYIPLINGHTSMVWFWLAWPLLSQLPLPVRVTTSLPTTTQPLFQENSALLPRGSSLYHSWKKKCLPACSAYAWDKPHSNKPEEEQAVIPGDQGERNIFKNQWAVWATPHYHLSCMLTSLNLSTCSQMHTETTCFQGWQKSGSDINLSSFAPSCTRNCMQTGNMWNCNPLGTADTLSSNICGYRSSRTAAVKKYQHAAKIRGFVQYLSPSQSHTQGEPGLITWKRSSCGLLTVTQQINILKRQ